MALVGDLATISKFMEMIKMGHKKSLKAKLALVGVILLVVLASFSFWTHRDDVFRGFDAGFEQSK